MVILDVAERTDADAAHAIVWDLASSEPEAVPPAYSVRVRDLRWLEDRRAIDAFFLQEVDRDRVVVAGATI